MDVIVAIDIETTGLDSQLDAIIEIGAVRFNEHRVEAEWDTLVHPGCRIPPFITQLTGITDQMVLKAPLIERVLPELIQFVGGAPILGHNVAFDVGFFKKYGLFKYNTLLDTYEMASVLLPTASRYSLGALAQELGVPYEERHRALGDAHTTRRIYLRLMELAMELPLSLLAEIIRLGEGVEWNGYYPFREVMQRRSGELIHPDDVQHAYRGPLFSTKPARGAEPLHPLETPKPLNISEISALLEPGGEFARHFPNYEYRREQVQMLKRVAQAFSEGQHLIVEAGTGTGKSIAYLIPAAFWAIQNQRRVVISTNTINLQDQLINKDIPDLCQALNLKLRATVIKGRSNYLCPRRLEHLRRRGVESPEEMRVLAKVLVWLLETKTGDRAELNLNNSAERWVWTRISAEDEGCTIENCLKRGGICPYYRVHQEALSAHLLIVNHALLLSDVAMNNRLLPDYEYLIVDEAHHMEEATTNALTYQITYADIQRLMQQLGSSKHGVLGRFLHDAEAVLDPLQFASMSEFIDILTDRAFRFEQRVHQFFNAIIEFLEEQRMGDEVGMYAQQVRITPAIRTQPAWLGVETSWEETELSLKPLLEMLEKLIQGTGEILPRLPEEDEELFSNLSNMYRRLMEFHDQIEALVFKPKKEKIYWVQVNQSGNHLALNVAPLHIGDLMERYIWHEKTSVIMTSATLTTAGEFDYLRGRLKAEEAIELSVGSPFDYETAALLYLVNDIPEPSDRHGHQRELERGLIQLCRATGGRTLVLFTSYEQLRRTSRAIQSILAKEDIFVLEQGEGASPHTLLETFRLTERAVLLGTRAFWEGIDVPGEALSVLVIAKLPFDVPSDPIISARAETFDDPFYEYSLPEAILRFRQGFGRLIRTQHDRGVVVIMDRRVLTKKYGQYFLDSLPRCTIQKGPLADLPRSAARWLNL